MVREGYITPGTPPILPAGVNSSSLFPSFLLLLTPRPSYPTVGTLPSLLSHRGYTAVPPAVSAALPSLLLLVQHCRLSSRCYSWAMSLFPVLYLGDVPLPGVIPGPLASPRCYSWASNLTSGVKPGLCPSCCCTSLGYVLPAVVHPWAINFTPVLNLGYKPHPDVKPGLYCSSWCILGFTAPPGVSWAINLIPVLFPGL